MSGMCQQGHICPDIFRLLLTSNVYRRYAETYLIPDLVDEVDIAEILAASESAICP
jgi:hypothetical protein